MSPDLDQTQDIGERRQQPRMPNAPNHLAWSQNMPEKLGKYELRGEIGRGACGLVFKGYDPFVQRDVAIKIAHSETGAQASAHGERNFFAEARAAGMLQHPHIVSLYDAGMEGNFSYIVMEYIDGDTLAPLCRRDGPRAPLEQVVDVAFKAARALDYSHAKGVLHRDIKPSNIMVTRDGVTKIMDFSIAEINAQAAGDGTLLGSPMYMSPEQVRQDPLGPPSDLYSLGAVIYQLLTGASPFQFTAMPQLFEAIKNEPAPSVRKLRPDVPQELAHIVEKLLYKNPEQRYANGRELATALSRLFDRMRVQEKQLNRRESRDSLRRLHFFNSFSDEEIDEIISASTMATFRAGDTIIEEGEIDNTFFIMAVGTAEVRKGQTVLHQLQRGDCFGEIGFLTAARRTATVVATQQVLALKVNATLMEQVSLECRLRFYKVFAETLIYRLSVTSAKLSAIKK